MDSGCALLIAPASFSRPGPAASLRVGGTSQGVPTRRRAEVFACIKNALKLKAHGTSGVDQVIAAKEPAKTVPVRVDANPRPQQWTN